jgi:hypothetical protein
MIRTSPLRTLLLTLVCVTLLVARIGGAHLHLCFDGSEPPASLHVLDVGLHGGVSAGSEHHDYDLMLGEQTLAKYGDQEFDLPALLLAVLVLLLVVPLARRAAIARSPAPRVRTPSSLHPPPRGPPGFSI